MVVVMMVVVVVWAALASATGLSKGCARPPREAQGVVAVKLPVDNLIRQMRAVAAVYADSAAPAEPLLVAIHGCGSNFTKFEGGGGP
jgi:hypothetical protein